MHLKSIVVKGFKSFPDRTRLDFGPGVSVVVGPNGSGKSNVTDAVLWAMGEQSPLAVRGASMQDVIFGGGGGRQAGQSAEVELVLDNADGALPLEGAEVSIYRRLDRSGDGEYRLNGARCRLADVIELLSDTGLGKESHSIVSQGRVETIVTSKPRDRRLLIEEAAGLGKHRKRRRRAQLKLERTQANLDRALDVEREARGRLRPLKRQAEAAELHERLERQTLEARWELARDGVRESEGVLAAAETAVASAHARRDEEEAALRAVAARRQVAEEALARRSEEREALSSRAYTARSARERLGYRLDAARRVERVLAERVARTSAELAERPADEGSPAAGGSERIDELQSELDALDAELRSGLEAELATLGEACQAAEQELTRLTAAAHERQNALEQADDRATGVREAAREAERAVEAARREAAEIGAELAAANQFLRMRAAVPGGGQSLADGLEVEPGCELAVAAALGGRLQAAVVADRRDGESLLRRAGSEGGRVLVARRSGVPAPRDVAAPAAGARPLGEVVSGRDAAGELAAMLLADAWLVDDLARVADDFAGVAVTRDGDAWIGSRRELRRVAAGGSERVLAERNRREELLLSTERAASAEQAARARAEEALRAVAEADAERDRAETALRGARRAHAAAEEECRRMKQLIERRRRSPDDGPTAVRRAQVTAELDAERRVAERLEREQRERAAREQRLRARLVRDQALAPAAERLVGALEAAATAIAAVGERFDAELAADRTAGEQVGAELRACAHQEAEVQARLRDAGGHVTAAEIAVQRARDRAAEAGSELGALAGRLGLAAAPATEPLAAEEREVLSARIERLGRRREQLGPVNPLAQDEYAEAVAHVEALEAQRGDLEAALRELDELVRETDREIRRTFEETFAAAAANFEEVVAQLFPGGRGRLRLVREDAGPRPVLGGEEPLGESESESNVSAPDGEDDEPELGVEIEITPAGKSMKRLSLLSGGEKSMTALAFIFSVFLARPCPFYILDEVEAALDDLNIGRFLGLLRRYAQRAQFVVVTHQKRTMEAADWLYGVSMGDDGVSKVVSRALEQSADAA